MLKIGNKALSGGEYSLMLGVISLTLVAGFETFTGEMNSTFDKLKTKIETIAGTTLTDEGKLATTLPVHLEPAVPPSTVSYLYNASKEPTSYEYPNYLYTYWTESDPYGSLNPSNDLEANSSFPEITYAINPSQNMNCVGSAGDYCWMTILMGGGGGTGLPDGSYNGNPIAIVGDRVGITNLMPTARDFVGNNTGVDYMYFSNFTKSLYFSPVKPYNWNTGWRIYIRIDGNQNETNILTNSITRGVYKLEDGTFNVAYPFSNASLYSASADMGLYEYVPSENSIINLYFAGFYDADDKHLINMSTVTGWQSYCHSIDGRDVVTLTNPENNYSAVFNFFRAPTFSASLFSSCDFTDGNTFVQ